MMWQQSLDSSTSAPHTDLNSPVYAHRWRRWSLPGGSFHHCCLLCINRKRPLWSVFAWSLKLLRWRTSGWYFSSHFCLSFCLCGTERLFCGKSSGVKVSEIRCADKLVLLWGATKQPITHTCTHTLRICCTFSLWSWPCGASPPSLFWSLSLFYMEQLSFSSPPCFHITGGLALPHSIVPPSSSFIISNHLLEKQIRGNFIFCCIVRQASSCTSSGNAN